MAPHQLLFTFVAMEKQIINTSKAPAPIGPYNQSVKVGNTLYVSGQIPIDPASGELIKSGIVDEAHQSMKNLGAVLEAAGMDFRNIVKTTIFLTDMNTFPQVNEVYGSYFSGDYPARETVQVAALPKGVNVEISVIAVSF
ncbi:2-iminobutanoate/2-iminopropanoate deaminase [Chitinophaga sp. 180180018-2]|nr:2-iminobutanoate/2-iminopropanoate deaminase [Chitinophaga sp. 212800010-3]